MMARRISAPRPGAAAPPMRAEVACDMLFSPPGFFLRVVTICAPPARGVKSGGLGRRPPEARCRFGAAHFLKFFLDTTGRLGYDVSQILTAQERPMFTNPGFTLAD